VAYLVPADHGEGIPAVGELRAFLGDRLPEFMVPATFTELAGLPLTPSGKIDRAALPAPDTARPDVAGFVGPADPIEDLLAGIWAELLGVDRVGVNDNFFDLGGHSLLVTQIVARVRDAGHEMSVGDLFQHPTITDLAPLVRARADDSATRLAVTIRSGTVHPAVFAVHTLTGEVAAYAEIAGSLQEGQQFHGLQERGLTGEDPPLESVPEMAAAYLDEVLRLQPDGPYLFMGQSAGCYVAVEMARQLAAMGGEVGGVFLLAPAWQRFTRSAKKHLDSPFTEADRQLLRELDEKIRAGGGQLSPEHEKRLLRGRVVDEKIRTGIKEGDEHALRIRRAVIMNGLLYRNYGNLMRYRLEPYDGRVVLFMPSEDKARLLRQTLALWRSVLRQEPETVDVPGQHSTVFDHAPKEVGAWLAAELDRWQRR